VIIMAIYRSPVHILNKRHKGLVITLWGVNLLIGLLCLGLIAGSNLITTAACLLLIFKFANLNTVFSILERRGLEMGLLFLIITLLIPLANGQVGGQEIVNNMTSLSGVLAITGGAVATYLNTIGIRLMRIDPEVVFGLVIGSIFGVVFLRGVPVGPLMAAGIAALFTGFLNILRR